MCNLRPLLNIDDLPPPTGIFLNPLNNSLLVLGQDMYIMALGQALPSHGIPLSHRSAVRAIAYNPKFNHVVSGCDGGVRAINDLNST